MKETYEVLKMEVISFESQIGTEEIIITSGDEPRPDNQTGPFVVLG